MYGFNFLFPQIREFDQNIFEYHINKDAINICDGLFEYVHIRDAVCWVTRWEDENINKSCENINDIRDMIEKTEVYCENEIIQNF